MFTNENNEGDVMWAFDYYKYTYEIHVNFSMRHFDVRYENSRLAYISSIKINAYIRAYM
jgi:hypothetical protein